jgi:hypothetical protein
VIVDVSDISMTSNIHNEGFEKKKVVLGHEKHTFIPMSRPPKTSTNQAFPQCKTALPQLTLQDLKVIFAPKGQELPQTTVRFKIPLHYDILCPQGVRDWKSQRAVSIEQSDITTINTEDIAVNSGCRVAVQPVNHFEPIDAMVAEIEAHANRMREDLELLGIPKLAHPPHVEPLFAYEYVPVVPEIENADTVEGSAQLTPRREAAVFTKSSLSVATVASTNRTKEKIRLAREVLTTDSRTGARKPKSDEKKDGQRRDGAGSRADWGRVLELLQDDPYLVGHF